MAEETTLVQDLAVMIKKFKIPRVVLILPDEHDSSFELLVVNATSESLRQLGHYLVQHVKDTRGPLI